MPHNDAHNKHLRGAWSDSLCKQNVIHVRWVSAVPFHPEQLVADINTNLNDFIQLPGRHCIQPVKQTCYEY